MPGSPVTPTRRSVRLLAKQLYHEELLEALSPVKDTKKHLSKTPQHRQSDSQEFRHTVNTSSARKPRNDTDEKITVESEIDSDSKAAVLSTPPHVSMHQHFLDSRQLDRPDLSTVNDKSPARKTPLKSLSCREVTEPVRRSPRLSTKHDNLMETAATAAKTNVGSVYSITLSVVYTCFFRYLYYSV